MLLCNPISGARPYTFSFAKNSHRLQNLGYTQIDIKDSFAQLIVKNVSRIDSGNYSCSVNNQFGQDSQWTILNVQGLK